MKSEAENREIFEKLPVPSALRAMVAPTIASQLIVLIYNMADTFYVGQTNNPYMVAGLSLILPLFNLTICLAALAGNGGGTLISRLLGGGREDEARRVSCFSLYLALASGLLFSLVMACFSEQILGFLGAGENTRDYANQYSFCVITLGAAPTVVSNVMSNLLRSTGRSKQASVGIIGGGLLNIGLDPLFMFVLLPEGREVFGAGIATCLSNCAVCVYYLIVLLRIRKDSVITFNPKVGLPSKNSVRAIFSVGLPAAANSFLFDLDYMIIGRLMTAHSDIAMAAIGIVLKVERLPLNVGVGICQGMVPLVAYNYAAKNYPRMNETVKCARLLGLAVGAASIVLYELFTPQIARFFISDAETSALAAQFLRVRILATPFMFMCFFTVYLFQAYGLGHVSFALSLVRFVALNIPMLLLLDRLFGASGVVWAQVAADGLTAALSLFVYFRHKRRLTQA